MQQAYRIILRAEEEFARAVALGLWVKRPLSAWHLLLPGMFLFDMIRRSAEIRRYSALFLLPRKTALDAALAAARGEEGEKVLFRGEEEIRRGLTSLNLYSPSLHLRYVEQMKILQGHYLELLRAGEEDYHSMIRSAYPGRAAYQGYLDRLASAEKQADEAIAEIPGETPMIRERLEAEQRQVATLREAEIDKIFSPHSAPRGSSSLKE